MPGRASSERRIYPRHRVRVAVLWRNRQPESMAGEICDVSAQGLFVVSTTAIPDEVSVGDSTEIAIPTKHGEEVLRGIVRWRGFHPAHQAIGCGIQLDEPSSQTIVRRFPILLESAQPRGAESISTSAPFPPSIKRRPTS
jgi:hypothetical protein